MEIGNLLLERRNGMAGTTESPNRKNFAVFMSGFDDSIHARSIDIAVVKDDRLVCRGVVFGIQPKIAYDIVHVAVLIEVASSDAVPPPRF